MALKIVVIIGSYRKGNTYQVVQQLADELASRGEIEFEFIFLKSINLKPCTGCGLCLEKGEEFCPLKDDRDYLYGKMINADGVIMATPVYSLQVTALLKNMLDRFAYIFHRPRFFRKIFMPVVTQGVYGGSSVIKYLEESAHFWGFQTCPGLSLTMPWDKLLPEEKEKMDREIVKAADRYYQLLVRHSTPSPSFKDLLIFRMVRSIHAGAAGLPKDHEYFKEQGWFQSDYYYTARIGILKRLLGLWADRRGTIEATRIKEQNARRQ